MITYRPYEDKDWQAICQIHDRARPDELKGSCDPRGFIPIEQDKEVEDLKRSKKFVACDGETVVGFVGVDEDYLAWLYVDPSHYGKGIGRELLRIGVREIGEGAWTIVLDGNKSAIALYESEGFREFGRFNGENNGYPVTCIKLKREMKFTPYEDVNQILDLLLNNVQEVLGDHFVGMYLYGSLATGDFNPESSDLDFCVVTKELLPAEIIAKLESMHNRIWSSPSKWAAKLEGSYLPQSLILRHDPNGPPCPTVNEGSFYIDHRGSDWIIQRHVIREQGIILAGPDPKTLIDPVSTDDIRETVLGVLNEWWFPMLDNPAWLVERGSEYHAYAIISMCRALHAIEHGVIVSKPVAAEWTKTQIPDQAQWIETALRSQHGGGEGFAPEALAFIRLVKDRVSP